MQHVGAREQRRRRCPARRAGWCARRARRASASRSVAAAMQRRRRCRRRRGRRTPWREQDLRAREAGRAGADHARRGRPPARLPTTLSALSSAASTTIAVPCWSSWKTGMSSSSRSRRSISKQRGAAMSSRLMPPNVGATALTNATISSTSLVSRHSGKASTPRELLEQHRLALHDRHRGLRADVAEPEHGGAVGDDRDRVALDGQRPRGLGSSWMAQRDARDAGRVGHRQVVAGLERQLGRDLDLAAHVHQERAVGDARRP